MPKSINRRKFIDATTKASLAFTILPRHVLGGPGYIAPSDKLNIAYIGCGTQGLREMCELITDPRIQITSVCDPNTMSTDYIDWSPYGIRDGIRKVLQEPMWGEGLKGIPGGREVGQELVNKYYGKLQGATYKGCNSYADFREQLEKETGADAVKIMTPDHLHGFISIAAMKKGKHVVIHKPIANRLYEARLTMETARQTGVSTHLLAWSKRSGIDRAVQWIKEGQIGTLREIHNWSYRPVWPQWNMLPSGNPPVPEGFNWDLWLGVVPDRPYHPNYTHNVFRGWYDFGGGSMADMGHYSLWPLFMALDVKTPPLSAEAYATTSRMVDAQQVSRAVKNDVAFPLSSIVRFKFPAQPSMGAFDLFWYDGGMKPHTPEEIEPASLESEGMMFVGDKGKIVGGFRCENPKLLPDAKMKTWLGGKTPAKETTVRGEDEWINAFMNKTQSPGSFLLAGPITETILLGGVALRSGKKLLYDSSAMRITNDEASNKYLYREYRKGWEL